MGRKCLIIADNALKAKQRLSKIAIGNSVCIDQHRQKTAERNINSDVAFFYRSIRLPSWRISICLASESIYWLLI